jgi:CheY-like chemotaxis protein
MPAAPTVYFIDDSATMREVIKIAFRRENINVVACHDAATALTQMDQLQPDVIISDVIMPGQDGYQVCEHIKRSARLGKTPVILMSGVVNRAVAERAFAVKADELIRKPFQPQDLIARVRHLLRPRTPAEPPAAAASASAALSSIFATSAASMTPMARAAAAPGVRPAGPTPPVPAGAGDSGLPRVAPPAVLPPPPAPAPAVRGDGHGAMDLQKIKIEVLRLQGLVRKLESELQAEREYSRALEAHVKTLQEAE